MLCLVSRVWLFGTPWTIVHRAPLSMGILQVRILEWVAMPSSRGPSQPRDWTQVSHIAGGFFTVWATRETPKVFFFPLRFTWKGKRLKIANTILSKMNTIKALTLLDFKTYYKALVIKRLWCWWKNRQINGVEVRIPEIGPHKCNQIYPLFLSDSMLMASTIILQIK